MLYDNDFEEYGFAICPDVLDTGTIENLLPQLREQEDSGGAQEGQTVYAMRNLLQTLPGVRSLAASRPVRALVEPYLGADCFAVRAIFFDMLPGANWKVPWHQDLSVAVAVRKETEGFGPWSRKAGVPHVQAPISLLERMLTVRLHLDACPLTNGPLRVVPGSHRLGRLNVEQIEALRAEINEVPCEIECGGALVMRPLLLHASSAAEFPVHRRVLHIEYANSPLPNGLEWYTAV